MSSTLVTCEAAGAHLDDPAWLFVDCRYELADPERGLREYAKAHIPGAYFAHIDRDLSGPVGDGRKGRHPLPIPGAFQRWAGGHGITPQTQVVCYDDVAGQWASRLWWLLRHYGHQNAAVLDGGLTRWKSLRLPLRGQHEKARATLAFAGTPGAMPVVDADGAAAAATSGLLLLDARAPERYRGEVEPVDKRAGHIPGAVNAPFAGNVGPDLRFLPPEALRERFTSLGVVAADRTACYCGSGVTGPHNVLAMEVAGLGTAALYPGSWSEWSFPPVARAVALGPNPV